MDHTFVPPSNMGFPVDDYDGEDPPGRPQPVGDRVRWGPNTLLWYTWPWAPSFYDLAITLQKAWKDKAAPPPQKISYAIPALIPDKGGPIRIVWGEAIRYPLKHRQYRVVPAPMEAPGTKRLLDNEVQITRYTTPPPVVGSCWIALVKGLPAEEADCCGSTLLHHESRCPKIIGDDHRRRHDEAAASLAHLAAVTTSINTITRPPSPPSTPTRVDTPLMPVTSGTSSPTLAATATLVEDSTSSISDTIVVKIPERKLALAPAPAPSPAKSRDFKLLLVSPLTGTKRASTFISDDDKVLSSRQEPRSKKVQKPPRPRCHACGTFVDADGAPFSEAGCADCRGTPRFEGVAPLRMLLN